MNDFIDQYCERVEPGLLGEPFNLFTNLAFLVAAAFAYRFARSRDALYPRTIVLLALLATIGIGSGLFHALATRWAEWADVLPILLFQVAFIWLYSRHVMQNGLTASAGLLLLFSGLSWFFGRYPGILNNSLGYAPAILVLAGLGIWHARRADKEKALLLVASVVFLCSLVFRTVDMEACSLIPVGTHFAWHILNGLVLYMVTRSYISNMHRPT